MSFMYTQIGRIYGKRDGQTRIQVFSGGRIYLRTCKEFFQEQAAKQWAKITIAWTNTLNGRFFTELEHDVRSLETPFGRQHIIEAIRWAKTTE